MGHGKEVGHGTVEPQPPLIDGDTDGRRHEGFGARIERVAAFGAERLGIALVGYLAMTQHDKAVEGRAGQRHEAVGEPGKCSRGYADALGRGSWQMAYLGMTAQKGGRSEEHTSELQSRQYLV